MQTALIERLCSLLVDAATIIRAQEEILLQHGWMNDRTTADEVLREIDEMVG